MWTYGDTRKPLLAQTTVTRGTQSWTTTPLYRFGLGNYNDYGRPWHSEEVDQANIYWKRITNQTFQDRLHAVHRGSRRIPVRQHSDLLP